jgi:hypothetical protein
VVAALAVCPRVEGQQNGRPPNAPPSPTPSVSRDATGHLTVRAERLPFPLRLDGQLDETVYQNVLPMSDFIQSDPSPGAPATERTEVWVFFDEDNVYVAARCWESHPERMVVNEMRRDSNNVLQNESFSFLFDTFHDQRNGVVFHMNPIGGRRDGQASNEMQQFNADWNPIWKLATGSFAGGWTVEAAVPFKSLRYRPGPTQIWGFNARRISRWKNELSSLAPLPGGRGSGVIAMASLAATLLGLEAPAGAKNLEIKPYAASHLTTDLASTPPLSNDAGGDFGIDAKYGIGQNMTIDATYHTDFAQVEADEQQVNLTRFSLFFPEKREFFLENQGTFAFGGARQTGGGDTPLLFYSRRIGLEHGRQVPINAGGRLTGRLRGFEVGALNIQTGAEPISGSPAANFSVVRARRDVLRRSSVGAIFTRRAADSPVDRLRDAYGVDGTFAFFDNLSVNTYWARTEVDGAADRSSSYRGQFDYAGDRYGLQLERLAIGEHFDPAIGFVRRADMRRNFAQFRYSPRIGGSGPVHKLSWAGSIAHIQNGQGRLETRDWDGELGVEFKNSDRFSLAYGDTYEFLPRPFQIASGVTIPIGSYDFSSVRVGFSLGQQRAIAGNLSAEYGSFYSGRKLTVGFSQGRVEITRRMSIEPSAAVNHIDLAGGSFLTGVGGFRATYTMTPLMFVSALLQYNSDSRAVSGNLRLRWEYQPGSELFIVLNEERSTLTPSFPRLQNRALIVKVNRLFRF